jgi:hypothetical protein
MQDENVEVLMTIVTALKGLEPDVQKRTIQAVVTFLGIQLGAQAEEVNNRQNQISPTNYSNRKEVLFSENRDISPKEFLRDKAPQRDIERVTCLAYYLTHYRDLPHFKTIDLSTLNTEAAQPKFSNTAVAVENAVKAGFLVPAGKGMKQISAAGEVFIQALPDREAAKASQANIVKRRPKKTGSKIVKSNSK